MSMSMSDSPVLIAAGARQARDDTRAHQIIRGCDHGNNGS
jgi:hypothetical protein